MLQVRGVLPREAHNPFDIENPIIPGIQFSGATLTPIISQIYIEKIVSDMHYEQAIKDFEVNSNGTL